MRRVWSVITLAVYDSLDSERSSWHGLFLCGSILRVKHCIFSYRREEFLHCIPGIRDFICVRANMAPAQVHLSTMHQLDRFTSALQNFT